MWWKILTRLPFSKMIGRWKQLASFSMAQWNISFTDTVVINSNSFIDQIAWQIGQAEDHYTAFRQLRAMWAFPVWFFLSGLPASLSSRPFTLSYSVADIIKEKKKNLFPFCPGPNLDRGFDLPDSVSIWIDPRQCEGRLIKFTFHCLTRLQLPVTRWMRILFREGNIKFKRQQYLLFAGYVCKMKSILLQYYVSLVARILLFVFFIITWLDRLHAELLEWSITHRYLKVIKMNKKSLCLGCFFFFPTRSAWGNFWLVIIYCSINKYC